MCDYSKIAELYSNVLHEDVQKFEVEATDIRTGIQNMKEIYLPDPLSLTADVLDIADYNDPAHRCAYLHKYAAIHTALVSDMFNKVVIHNIKCLGDIIHKTGHFNVCSLGGGPGNDIIGVLDVLHSTFGYLQVRATIVDYMIGWSQTFYSTVQELQNGNYGSFGECFSDQYFNWSYLTSNLLGKMSNEVNRAISSADLVTMVKFVSACACKDTPAMIGKIFRTLKQGSLVLYIDNAGGGFHQMVRKEAQACDLITVFGPLKHEHYTNATFNTKRFGYTPCLETTITVHVWRKPCQNEPSHMYQVDNAREHSLDHFNLTNYNQVTIINDPAQNPDDVFSSGVNGSSRLQWNDNIFRHSAFKQERQLPRFNRGSGKRGRSSNRTLVQTQPRGMSRQHLIEEEPDEEEAEDECGTCCIIS